MAKKKLDTDIVLVQWLEGKPGHRRVFKPHQLEQIGINSKLTLVWDAGNSFRLEMSRGMSESLVKKLPTEFIIIESAESQPEEQPKDSPAKPDSAAALTLFDDDPDA